MTHQIDFTAELSLLLNFVSSVAAALRLFTIEGCENFDSTDSDLLTDSTFQISQLADTIREGDAVKVAASCLKIQNIFSEYEARSPTFAYWGGVVDIGYATRVLEAVRSKAKSHIFRVKSLNSSHTKSTGEATFWS